MVEKFKENFYESLLDSKVQYYGYIVDKNNYELIYINKTLLNELRKENTNIEDYENKKCYELLQHLDQPCEHCNIYKLNLNEEYTNFYYNAKYEFWFNSTETLVKKDGKELVCHNLYNVTNEIDEINKLKEQITQDRVIIACAQTLMDKTSFDVSINLLLEIICNFYGGNYACLFERDYKTSMSNVTYKYHREDINLIDKKYTASFRISPEDAWTSYLKANNYAFLQTSNDIDKTLFESSYYTRFMESKRNNLLVVSLKDNDKILGAIEIDNVTKNIDNISLISTICAFIVNNLHIKNVNEDLQENVVDLENKNALNNTMLECIKTLVYDDDITRSMNKLLDVICNYFSATATNIVYKNNLSNMFDCAYAYSTKENHKRIESISCDEFRRFFNRFNQDGVGYIPSLEEMYRFLGDEFVEYPKLKARDINSYLFAPLYRKSEIVGYICVDNPVKNIKEKYLLLTMSTFVVNHINKNELLNKLEKLSYTDSLTNLYNRNFYNNYVDEFKTNPRKSMGVIFADVNGLKKANDNFGHEIGDDLIKWAAKFFKQNFDGLIFRIGGDEFVGINENVTKEKFDELIEELTTKLAAFDELHISVGYSWSDNYPNAEHLISTADSNMYIAKKEYYKELAKDDRSVRVALEEFKKSIEKLNMH